MINHGQYFFTHPSGEDVFVFTLTNNRGTEVRITNYGAIITSFTLKLKDGSSNDIVLGFHDPADYLSQEYLSNCPYFGASIGRYANRIENGAFQLDGRTFHLPQNDGLYHLHGGQGFHTKVWKPVAFLSGPNPFLELEYRSVDREEGYPGNLDVHLRFSLTENDELIYEYNATTDQPTAVNLTHHSYFNLDITKKNIGAHSMRIYSDEILEQDGYTITGRTTPVENTEFDFRTPRPINENWDPESGFDHCFILDRKDDKQLFLAAEATSQESKLKLQVWTSEPAVQFYTGKWIPQWSGKNGLTYGPFTGFCIEPQVHTNAINIPHFPNTVLSPDDVYYHKTMYRVIQ
jgi:aldose 1-epimerase